MICVVKDATACPALRDGRIRMDTILTEAEYTLVVVAANEEFTWLGNHYPRNVLKGMGYRFKNDSLLKGAPAVTQMKKLSRKKS